MRLSNDVLGSQGCSCRRAPSGWVMLVCEKLAVRCCSALNCWLPLFAGAGAFAESGHAKAQGIHARGTPGGHRHHRRALAILIPGLVADLGAGQSRQVRRQPADHRAGDPLLHPRPQAVPAHVLRPARYGPTGFHHAGRHRSGPFRSATPQFHVLGDLSADAPALPAPRGVPLSFGRDRADIYVHR